MKRHCFTLNLKNDPKLIAEYEAWHRAVWPEVIQSIKQAGIEHMEIYRFGGRLFMIMDVNDGFTFEGKAQADAQNAKVQQWETLMWKYQQQLPDSQPGEKWMLMNAIFDLKDY
jgi:L-rhamnose mutarotase